MPKPELARQSSVQRPRERLLSDFVCRVAGLPTGLLQELRAEESLAALTAGEQATLALAKRKDALADALFAAVGGQEDQDLRRALLNTRRDVHNLRPPKERQVRVLRDGGFEELAEELESYRQEALEQRRLLQAFESTFHRERSRLRARFQEQITDEDFRRGLLLSSRALADELPRYLRAPARKPRAKERQIERSLMRYFSRMAMKATPFGTFCALTPGSFDPRATAPGFSADPRRKRSRLRLNKVLYAVLAGHMQSRPEIRRHLEVELNPTLQTEGEKWLYLQATLGREVFQRLPRNPVLDLLADRLARPGHLPLAELIRELETHPEIEATPEEATAYLERLLEVGFLRFRLGIREQEVDWDRPLVAILEPIDVPEARAMVALLRDLRAAIDTYPEASLETRRDLVDRCASKMHDLLRSLGTRPQAPADMPPFYEDAAGRSRLRLSPGDLEEILAEYLGQICRLSWFHCEQANMRHFFDRYYPEGEAVPLLRYYEDYYREHFKSFLEKQRNQGRQQPQVAEGTEGTENGEETGGAEEETGEPTREQEVPESLRNPFGLELIEQVFSAQDRVGAWIRERWREDPTAEEITLDHDSLQALLEGVPEVAEPCRSVSVFAQMVPGAGTGAGAPREDAGGDDSKLVLAGIFNGYGKYFSRFLYLLPEEVAESLRASNLELSDHLLAEICGDGSFNANLHPPLLPWEISYPTGESGADDEQIPSSELLVEADPRTPHKLRLRWARADREVVPVDLGFLNPRMRPPLFQLLSHFTPASAYTPQAPAVPIGGPNEMEGEEVPEVFSGPVLYRPRVTYRGRLVISRRRWTIPDAAFPSPRKGESEAAYFQRLQEWRRRLDIPEEVFFKINVRPAPPKQTSRAAEASTEVPARNEEASAEANEPEAAEKRTPNDHSPPPARVRQHLHKPQYLDFGNPLLVDLFGRATANLPSFDVHLEEMLPGRDQLLAHEGDRYVTELILQIDFPGEGAEPS